MSSSLRNASTLRVLQIIEEVVSHENGIAISELEKKLGIHKSTIYRYVATLRDAGYLEQDEDTKYYKVGLNLFSLGSKIVNSINWTKEVRPYLVELRDTFQETVHLGVADKGEVIYIDKVESEQSIRMYSKVGVRSPIYCTGIGKAILAHLPKEKQASIIDQLELKRYTENTIVNKEKLAEELQKIVAKGYALDLEEHELGVVCAAVPIFNYNGELLGAISVAGPAIRIDEIRLLEIAKKIKELAQSLKLRLGVR